MKLLIIIASLLCISVAKADLPVYPSEELPEGLVWITDNTQPILGSPDAKRGGRFTTYMLSYPLTFRNVGPDSNSGLALALRENQLALVTLHPFNDSVIPQLATHWAFGNDGRTVYYKLDPSARWSDDVPVVADDYLYQWDFMRSKDIVAPWYNKYYGENFESVKKYDDHTISITGSIVKPGIDLFYYYGLKPRARHFHILDKDWVRAYNWRIEPNTGPYNIGRFKAGKFVEFERKDDWWGNGKRYFKNRYNADVIRYQVIRDPNVAFKYFEKGYIDSYPLILPDHWINKTKGDVFERNLVNRFTFYTDTYRSESAIYLNQAKRLLKNKDVRIGIAHSMHFKKIINGLLNGEYARLNSLTVGYGNYSNDGITVREFDLDKAKFHFEKAGFKKRDGNGILINEKGEPLRFELLYRADIHTPRLLVLKEEAKKAGLDMVLKKLDSSTMFKTMIEKQHEAAWTAWGTMYRPQYWGQWHSDNANKPQTNNVTNTSIPQMDELIDAYRASSIAEERERLSREINQLIHEEAAAIPRTYVPFTRWGYWRWLQLPEFLGSPAMSDPFNPFGIDGGYFWIDSDIKQETQKAKKGDKVFPNADVVDTRYKKAH